MSSSLDEISPMFVAELFEQLGRLTEALLTFEGAGPGVLAETLSDFMRDLHSIKGTGASLGFGEIASLAHALEDRMLALDRKFGPQGYPVIAIMSSDASVYEEDSFEQMQARAKTKNYTFPYLSDDTQLVAKAFGAIRSPQVYVLKHSGEHFTVEYIGSIDDSPQSAAGVQRAYVDEATTSLLANRPVVTPLTKAIGCAIKMK